MTPWRMGKTTKCIIEGFLKIQVEIKFIFKCQFLIKQFAQHRICNLKKILPIHSASKIHKAIGFNIIDTLRFHLDIFHPKFPCAMWWLHIGIDGFPFPQKVLSFHTVKKGEIVPNCYLWRKCTSGFDCGILEARILEQPQNTFGQMIGNSFPPVMTILLLCSSII